MSERKRILSPFEWIILVLAVLLILYIIRPDGKFTLFERSETVTILDKPTNSQRPPGARKNVYDSDRLIREEVDNTLRDLAMQYSGGKGQNITQSSLTSGERQYLDDVKRKHELDDRLKNAADWYRLLKTSHSTYNTLKSVLSEASGEAGLELEQKPLTELFREAETADGIYDRLYELYNISRTKSSKFAQSGPKTLSDWAEFVSNNAKE